MENTIEFKTPKGKAIFVKVPDGRKDFRVHSIYNTILCSKGALGNDYKDIELPIHTSEWKVVGQSHKLTDWQCRENLGISLDEYIGILKEKDVTVDYSNFTGEWIVLI
jgi:hypothetical protein